MLPKNEREEIIRLIRSQVLPAMGCTEPACVALAVARATELVGEQPASITARLSTNILKNAMGVGIPGTGMVGLPIAIALGALIGHSAYGLEVLRDCQPDDVERGQAYIAEGCIHIELKADAPSKLYVEVVCTTPTGDTATVVIAHEHTNYIYVAHGEEVLYSAAGYSAAGYGAADSRPPISSEQANGQKNQQENGGLETAAPYETAAPTCAAPYLMLRKVFDFATTTPLEEINFINEARRLNEAAAAESLKGNYGHCLGKALSRPLGRGIMGDSIFSHILANTACACDARMAGAMIPVMSNSGSGNQGICATNPVVVFAEENHNTDEELTRALTLSHLTAIYIKQSLGALSALCGCVVAATGAGCGITLLMGGGYEQVVAAVKNMIANLTGMICDGAKPSCALKLTTGVSTAVLSAMLAMQGNCVSSVEGIIDDDVDKSIRNLTSIGADAMNETDRRVLDIMTSK